MNEPILKCERLSKTYQDGRSSVMVLDQLDFALHAGERVAIVGPSGSGKSTLLHILSGLDEKTSGHVWVNGRDWSSLSARERCRLRNHYFGFVYQFHHLLPEFSALENVAMPLLLAGYAIKHAEQEAKLMLTEVGLAARLAHRPAQLSGGERQRVAIARALVHQPTCLLADEPTGNLDQSTAARVFDKMLALNEKRNTALIIVTHDRQLADRMDKVMVLVEGRLMLC